MSAFDYSLPPSGIEMEGRDRPGRLEPVLVTPSSGWIVTIEEARRQVGVEDDERDNELLPLIDQAQAFLDGPAGIVGIALLQQSWRQDFPAFPASGTLRLPFGPLMSVDSVAFLPASGGPAQTLDPSAYSVHSDYASPFLHRADGAVWPATARHPAAVSVTFTAGKASAESIHRNIKRAALLLIGQWFSQREAGSAGPGLEIPFGVTRLILPLRRIAS